ncbi:MAG: hypothetical protein ABSG81_03145 [Acidimicrobiales bacterium]|jgi:hypothetical protein
MASPKEPTRAARRFRAVVVAGAAVIAATVFLPWASVSGYTYTFLGVDSWKVLPVGELVVVAAGAIASMVWLGHVKRIGLLVGGAVLVLDTAGWFAAARLADVHNTDTYFRIWAAITVRPAWAGWIGVAAGFCLLTGAAANWAPLRSEPGPDTTPAGSLRPGPGDLPDPPELPRLSDLPDMVVRPPVTAAERPAALSDDVSPATWLAEDWVVGPADVEAQLPHLDDVLAPPRRVEHR